MFESVAYAMGTPQAGAGPASGTDMLMQFLPLIVMFAIFWFLLIRPQQKRAKAHKAMLAELKELLEKRGFKEGNTSTPGDFVIERAFVEK